MSAVPVVREAARNNAEWCDSFCRACGVVGCFEVECWSSSQRTPLLYPDAVTLVPGVSAEELLERIDTSAGCSVKDSFADLDLKRSGFDVLFRAEWLRQEAPVAAAAPAGWSIVTTPAQLAVWERAWAGSPAAAADPFFSPRLLTDKSVAVLARLDGEELVSGLVANRSSGAIGLSNLFDLRGDPESAWLAGATAARALWGQLPAFSYGYGDSLDAATRSGFSTVGELAVWVRPENDSAGASPSLYRVGGQGDEHWERSTREHRALVERIAACSPVEARA